MCSECPPLAETHAFRCLSLIVINSFVDRCQWHVIPDLLQCTFQLRHDLGLQVKSVKSLKHCIIHILVKWVEVQRMWWWIFHSNCFCPKSLVKQHQHLKLVIVKSILLLISQIKKWVPYKAAGWAWSLHGKYT